MAATMPPHSVAQISIRRIHFTPEAAQDKQVILKFADPHECYAISEEISLETLPKTLFTSEAEALLYVVIIPGGTAIPAEWKEWIHKSADSDEPAIELDLKGDRVFWRPGQAVIISQERTNDVLSGLVYFAFLESELSKIERGINANWKTAQADVPYIHGVDPSSFKKIPHVNKMTAWAMCSRMDFARIEKSFELPPRSLPGTARRVISELSERSDLSERMEHIDSQIEVYEELYTLCNDRISEFSYYHHEYWLEIWIIIILIGELAFMAADLWVTLNHT